nr:hypothetical protein [Actinosynnema sp. ALI-1.44]
MPSSLSRRQIRREPDEVSAKTRRISRLMSSSRRERSDGGRTAAA